MKKRLMTERKASGEAEIRRGGTACRERVRTDFSVPIVLGIDPGSRVIGYGALVAHRSGPRLLACGVLRADAKGTIAARLGQLRGQLDELLERLRPTVVVVEQAFAARNVQSALRIGEARGVVLAAAALIEAEITQYPPAVAKRTLIGNGRADKRQVARMVTHELGSACEGLPLDSTDALALALTFVYKQGVVRGDSA
jgi:crossover junction endodeoxyribonuclease RuvC